MPFFEEQGAKDASVFFSGALRACAIAPIKISNDMRWLGSWPRCGLGELRLPAVQPGSSIMPGKINPVIAESLLMICSQVIGRDAAIAWCRAAGNLAQNVMMLVMCYDLLESIRLMAAGIRNFRLRRLDGLKANRDKAESFVDHSLAMATALTPVVGYERAATLAKEAHRAARTIREVAREQSARQYSQPVTRSSQPELTCS